MTHPGRKGAGELGQRGRQSAQVAHLIHFPTVCPKVSTTPSREGCGAYTASGRLRPRLQVPAI